MQPNDKTDGYRRRLAIRESFSTTLYKNKIVAVFIAVLLHDSCAMHDPLSRPLSYAKHHTILVVAISCKGQVWLPGLALGVLFLSCVCVCVCWCWGCCSLSVCVCVCVTCWSFTPMPCCQACATCSHRVFTPCRKRSCAVAPLLALCSCEWFVLLSCAYACDLLIV